MEGLHAIITDDATRVLREAGRFLKSKPSDHNLLLSLLEERAAHPEPGRFWWASDAGTVVAVMFQSPLDFHATISPAAAPAVAVLAAHAAEQTPDLPGISGDAATAAFFAGCWAEQRKTPAVPLEGQRLYELGELRHPDGVPGRPQLRHAPGHEVLPGPPAAQRPRGPLLRL